MKVSVNWIKEYLAFELPDTGELVKKIGAQLGEVEGVEDWSEKYRGVIIVKIVSCEKHPNADRLHVCWIDDGGKAEGVERNADGHVQVVCGAPNVREGLTVAWLPPGSTVPESYDKDPFVLEARELRGVVSNGMLASPKELALSDSHDGILELDDERQAGEDFATAYGLNDQIIDIENKMFTHRPDCFGELGVAREVSGIFGQKFTSPTWYAQAEESGGHTEEGERLPLSVENELPSLVPRFMAAPMSEVAVKPSPLWLQTKLARVGLRPINNVVDITNYLMVLTGQPLHAYDYDKVADLSEGDAAALVVRNPRDSERLQLLNGKTIDPRSEAIMIATNKQAIGLGGVMGGGETEVDENTRRIIVEVATFDMYSIRRTAMTHGLFTDAVTRFNKGQSPLQNDKVMGEALRLFQELAGAKLAGEVIDNSQVADRAWVHPPVPVSTEFINTRLGLELSAGDMQTLLENVEFEVEIDGDKLTVTAPFWRTDIESREDVVEEVGRLYGFDHLPLVLPRRSIRPVAKDALLERKKAVRENLVKSGANELLTYSFVHGNLLDKVGQDKAHAFSLSNALSPDLQYYRLSLTPSLLEKVHPNIKAGYDEFALFELGKTHMLGEWDAHDQGVPNEDDHVALVVTGSDRLKVSGAPYYRARRYLAQLNNRLVDELVPMQEFDLSTDAWGSQLVAPYDPKRSALIIREGQIWGVVGEFKSSVMRDLKLPRYTAAFEVHLDALRTNNADYRPLPRFPKITQDITLQVAGDTAYRTVYECITQTLVAQMNEQMTTSVEPLGAYQPEAGAPKNLSFRISAANFEKTMREEELSQLLETIAAAARDKLHANRI